MGELIKTDDLVRVARERGFDVREFHPSYKGDYVEIGSPETPVKSTWHNGAQYVGSFAVLHGDPNNYAYNDWFYGPFHPGYIRRSAFGTQELLNHPLMKDCGL